MGWSLYDASTGAREASDAANHTHEVLDTIAAVENHLSRAESALRGYVVSGNTSFIIERDTALFALTDKLQVLKGLVAGTPEQKARTQQLDDLTAKRIALMDQTVKQRDTGALDISAELVRQSQQTSAGIFDVTREIGQVERKALDAAREYENRRYDRTMLLLFGAAALALGLVVPMYVMFMRQTRAREEVERKLYDMADSIPGVVYQYCSHPQKGSHYEFLSSGVTQLYGVDRDDALADPAVIGRTVLEEDRAVLSAAVAKAAQSLVPLQHDFRITTPAGQTKWVRSSAAPRAVGDGAIVWSGHWADVTDQKTLQQALHEAKLAAEAANTAKSSFLAVMSHEIRTPLNGILGMLELLSLSELDAGQRTTVNVVRESGRSLQRIIDDILDFSKIEAGKLEIEMQPASLRQIVESTRNIYSGNASSKGLLLTCSVDPDISAAHVFDPHRLRQILNNLVSNAIKFTYQGTIEVKAELLTREIWTETVCLTVSDSGIGMSEEAQARIFEPFVQAGAGTARKFGGTGLGLTISRRLVDMMGGTIELSSTPGKGTTIRITLPLTIADPEELPRNDVEPARRNAGPLAPVREAPSVGHAERERTLVLLVDDHPVNRMLLQRQVNTLGYAAETASDGVEALEKWKSDRYAAVISDINMPEMDGYELARRIRRIERERGSEHTPLIACTANALKGEAEACLEAGMDDYLAKPVQLAELQKKLDTWLPLSAGSDHGLHGSEPPEPLLDRSVLAALSNDETGVEAEILDDFRRVNDRDAAALREYATGGEFKQTARMAHRIKGASRMVGLTALGAIAERLEHAAQAEDGAAVQSHMHAFERELERVNRYVDALRVPEVQR
ncbi:MAG TPA: ATP-binding protein [Burkholderiales bacterium]|nr:ATP-binding protein [Burkholderiales bacterium]